MSDANEQPNSEVATLPQVHPDNEEAWAAIEASTLGDRMKRALRRVAAGESFREAAKAEQYSTHSDVYRAARKFGLISVTKANLVDRFRRVSDLSFQELEQRLVDDPSSFSTQQLGVVGGIAADKVAKAERWGTEPTGGGDAIARLEQIGAALAGQGLRLDVTLRPSEPAQPVIDETPTE